MSAQSNLTTPRFLQPMTNLVVLGAGDGTELESLLKHEAEQFYLYEGHSSAYQALCETMPSSHNIKVINRVVAAVEGITDFHHHKPQQFSGINTKWVTQAFKNAVCEGTQQVPALSLANVIEQHPSLKNANSVNGLILDLNGIECDVINSTSREVLDHFSYIELRTVKANQDTSEPISQACALASLISLGFELIDIKKSGLTTTLTLTRQLEQTEPSTPLMESISEARLKPLQAEFDEYQQTVSEEFSALHEELDKLIEEKQGLVSSISSLESRISEFTTENTELAEVVRVLEESKKALEVECNNLASRISHLESRNTELTTENTELTESKKGLEADCNTLASSISHLESTISNLESRISDLTTKNTELAEGKKRLEAERNNLASSISNLESRTSELTTENTELTESKRVVEESNKGLEAERNNLASRISHLESRISELTTENTELTESKKGLEAERNNLASSISHLESSISNLESRTSELTTENTELTESKKGLEAERKNLASRISSLESTISNLESENQELTRSARLNQKMLAKSQIDLDDLRNKYAEKKSSESDLIELIKELREKLTIASKYYYQLQQEHPELLHNTATENK
ncbi:hypothetical protein [Vibrio sp. 10N]|uniref:hypothetical protein n=1 Tax=Vibrio sp. 10N TaxID=3058938 RepID=UPI002813B475|nr:hypothetical protein VB10N_28890 [Vibrio sp. 10N]